MRLGSVSACASLSCLLVAASACNGEGDSGISESASASDIGGDPTGDPDQVPPMGEGAILPWLENGSYEGWTAESEIHPSAGPHGQGVRTFINDMLFDSLDAGMAQHPPGAAAIKEIYTGGELDGWAVSIKLDTGTGAEAWYWFERFGGQIYADSAGDETCVGCHYAGIDFVRSPFPLQ